MEPRLLCVAGGWRRDAASAAAQAAVGLGNEASTLDEKEKAHLRNQTLFLLRLELDYRKELIEAGDVPSGVRGLGLLLCRPDFAGLREPGDLAKLSPKEAEEWKSFWDDVRSVLKNRS